jgi:hypothetical protein
MVDVSGDAADPGVNGDDDKMCHDAASLMMPAAMSIACLRVARVQLEGSGAAGHRSEIPL